jgi:hypothetical protein
VAASPYFRFYRNGIQISGNYQAGTTFTATAQPAGTWAYSVQAVDAAGNASSLGLALNVTIDTTSPTVTSVQDVSPDPRTTSVSTLDVVFSKPINLSTFTFANLGLTLNGNPVALTGAVTTGLVSGSTYQISGLDSFTAAAGTYVLTVNATGIQDLAGNFGTDSGSESWLVQAAANQPPTLAAVADQAVAAGGSVTVALQGSDPGGLPLTYSATAETQAYYLKSTLGLYLDPGGLYTNYRGQGEEYLRGTSSANNFNNGGGDFWYYILPGGDLYEFTAPYVTPALTGTLVAHLGVAYYNDPTLLTDASSSPPPVTLGVAGNELTITPGDGYTGTFVVVATADDGQASTSTSFKVTVQ